MADSNIAELKAQFGRMQTEINATLELLKKLQGDTVIVAICPERCAPFWVDPPRLDDRCDYRLKVKEQSITVQDAEDAILMADRWMENMIRVLDVVEPDLPLPYA